MQIDGNFVYEEEGDELSMYVPKDTKETVLGMSGATIAKGVDLGQMSDYDLDMLVRDHGLSPALANKLRPYLGRQKDDAARFVDANPLTIDKTEAHEIVATPTRTANRAFRVLKARRGKIWEVMCAFWFSSTVDVRTMQPQPNL